jgi:hypothetical protein
MTHRGSCHCGQLAFEVEGTPTKVIECNCSICNRRGALHWFVASDDFRLLTSGAATGTYTFNKHAISHRFCTTCGCAPYSEGLAPSGHYRVAVNARCLDDLDLASVETGQFDGRSL